MRLTGQHKLMKYKFKNQGNELLFREIANLIYSICNNDWINESELVKSGRFLDKVHNDGFYFFDLLTHRVLILIEFISKDATIIWIGNHQDYMRIFKNNKDTIKSWLKARNYI
jgi:mRNA interferase HigB